LYHHGALWLAFMVVNIIQQALGVLIFSIITYRMIELQMPFLTFYYPMNYACVIFASTLGMWCGFMCNSATSAVTLFIVFGVCMCNNLIIIDNLS
jgi:hypothetical protein